MQKNIAELLNGGQKPLSASLRSIFTPISGRNLLLRRQCRILAVERRRWLLLTAALLSRGIALHIQGKPALLQSEPILD